MLRTSFSGEELTHRLLWRIVKEQAKEAQERAEGWFYPSVVARVFAYHTVEAHLNYVGSASLLKSGRMNAISSATSRIGVRWVRCAK